jgi:DNA cross-link repair 1C protein
VSDAWETFDEMSTFDGYIKEFPDITGTSLCVVVSYKSAVDHFTHKPHRRPPRAAFLSHVHQDHMNGLECYDSSLIYCSHATKEVCTRNLEETDELTASLC